MVLVVKLKDVKNDLKLARNRSKLSEWFYAL